MDFTWKHKLLLISLGLILGAFVSEFALSLLSASKVGSEFENLEDLRASMLQEDAAIEDKSKSVPLRAIVTPHPDDKIIYTLRPNLNVRFQKKPLLSNTCGMRDKEFPILKPENTYRIALLGDSFAFGWGVEQNESFAAQLENNLNRMSTEGTKFEVLNFGVPGYSTFQEVKHFKEEGADFDLDAVIVFFVRNDFGFPFFVKNISGETGILSSVKFLSVLNKATDPEQELAKLENRKIDPNRAISRLSDFTRERGIKLFVAINPKQGWKHDYRRLTVLKKRRDITTMFMRKNYLHTIEVNNIPEKDLTLSNDPHPSALRHKMYADLMTPYFMDIVR